ncbi:vanillate monooxygenase [Sphingobium sp. C100]|uniref:aromatic ring-hydroxylating dioxygenase subunit alpha n=1 Tax=Sphingobium sp. C100 TaxID=1207055 RepID=UPI0003D648C8|nr:aromatic ring-hydroxylating dioxygenase subunit alpha [Sphingobium sp. C100]ETI65759.1 vanillate monooxygenase [Sphingobium sp. C100]
MSSRAPHRSYPLNAWYMACWADDLAGDRLLARTLLDRPIILFRDAQGAPAALNDMCPHRFAPLSRGRVQDGVVQCGYHGLRFDASGACLGNASTYSRFPPDTRVASYRLVERHRAIWIWPGDGGQANPDLIPRLSRIPEAGGHENLGNYLHVQGNWLLETDNIMDLTHVHYLHDGSLGNESMRAGDMRVSEKGGVIRAELWMPDTICPFGPLEGQLCDQWNNVEWHAPSAMIIDFGAVLPGEPPVQDEGGYAFHIFTPETERTTHYFFGSSGSYAEKDAWRPRMIGELQNRIFLEEDNPMIEAIQDRMAGRDFWDMHPAILSSDAAAIRVRRKIAKLCREEGRAAG